MGGQILHSWPLTPYMTLKRVKMLISFGIFEFLAKFTFNLMYHSTKLDNHFWDWPWPLLTLGHWKGHFLKVIRFNRSIAHIEGLWKTQQAVKLFFEILTFFKVKYWGQGHKTGKKSWFWHFLTTYLTLRKLIED